MAPADLTKEQILGREARWSRGAAIASFLSVLLFVGSIAIEQAGGLLDRDDDATHLTSFHEHHTALLGTGLMLAIGSMLMAVPLFYLFKAAEARNEKVRPVLVAFAFIGPVLYGVQALLGWAALKDVAADFVNAGGGTDQMAEDLMEDSGFLTFVSALALPAIFGLMVGLVYISLMSMRTGLLTRFFGTLGMALGASFILFPPVALLGMLLWLVYVGMLIGDFLPNGRPPAWAAATEIPWPKPGDEIRDPSDPLSRHGTAGGEAVEGSGRELSEPPLPEEGAESAETGALTGTQGERRKKRKRRG